LTSRQTTLAYIPALDGVRAVAVLLVIAYHFDFPGFGGGFLGVDLFFVLSGFLITTLLLAERTETGRVDMPHFWLRRARRLLPALFVLLAVVAVAARSMPALERGPLRGDMLSSIFYSANWRFVLSGQSYFAEFVAPSPLRHLWSLAIEEQFYLLWPLLFAVGFALYSRRGVRRAVAAGAMALGIAASIAVCAALFDVFDPSRAYYGTDARAHELLIGAGVAMLLFPRQLRGDAEGRSLRIGRIAAVAGIGVVLAMALTLQDDGAFYYHGGSVLFSLGAVSLVAGVLFGSGIVARALSVRPVVWIGKVSYGMYLWHWPAAVWLTPARTGLSGASLALTRLGATTVVTALSFYLIERPIRRGQVARVRLTPRVVFPVAAALALLLSGAAVAGTSGSVAPPNYLAGKNKPTADVSPGARATVALVGDSVAVSLYPGFAAEAAAHALGSAGATFSGCAVGLEIRADASGKPFANSRDCVRLTRVAYTDLIRRYDPTIVVWYSGRERYDIWSEGRIIKAGSAEWKRRVFADWERTRARLTAGGARVVLVPPLPAAGRTVSTCADPAALRRTQCTQPYLQDGILRSLYVEWATGHADVRLLDLATVVCPAPAAPCPRTIDGLEVREDGIHFSPAGARWFARRLFDQLF